MYKIIVTAPAQKDLQNALEEVLSQIIGKSVGVDLERDAIDDKKGFLDLEATVNNNEKINVEVQLYENKFFIKSSDCIIFITVTTKSQFFAFF